MGVAYAVLAVDGWYEQIDEKVKSRAVSTHFGLEVLDQLLIRGIELDASRLAPANPSLTCIGNSSYMVLNV